MRSRTSFFDSRIFRSALSRFWPVGLGCALLWTFAVFNGKENYYYMAEEAGVQLLRAGVRGGAMLCMLTAVAMAAAVYGWMFFTESAAFVSALPTRRETVFLSDMAAGFFLLEGACVAALGLAGVLGGLTGLAPVDAARFLGVVTLLNILYFGFASLCTCLTGNILILPAVYAVLLYAAVALESSLRALAHFLIFGLTGSSWKLTALSPSYHLRIQSDNMIWTDWAQVVESSGWPQGNDRLVALTRFTGWPLLCGYAAAGVVFAALAVALIRRRRMESAGSVVAIPFLKKAFPWCAALAGALTMGLVALKMVFNATGYLSRTGSFHQVCALLGAMLLGVFLGWFGAQGLLRRTIRVFDRSWGGFAVACAVTAALVLSCEADVFGVERAQVDPSRVGYVTVNDTYVPIAYETRFQEPENIAAALALQKKIVENKSVYENAPSLSRYSNNSALFFNWYDSEGNLLQSRVYIAPEGVTCWASNGDVYAADYGMASSGDAWASSGDAWASSGDAWASSGDVWVSSGDVWASGGNSHYSAAPSGSGNPALADLEALLNTPEAVRQRIYPQVVPASPSTVYYGYYYRVEDYMTVENVEFSGSEAWELYSQCIIPDAEDGNLGRIQICPTGGAWSGGYSSHVGLNLCRGYGNNAVYDSLFFLLSPQAERTCAWLADRGIYIPGWETPVYEPPAETVYEAQPLEGLAALLENVKLNYDPAAAGTVGAVRWARAFLEWYSANGEDPFRTYEDAKNYAWMYLTADDVLPEKLERLRRGGEQLVSGSLGLIRDRNSGSWTADTVNDLFDAIRAGLTAGTPAYPWQ